MNISDVTFVFQWWIVFFGIGLVFLPLTAHFFSNFFDRGYIFSKVFAILFISYAVFLLGITKILPFTQLTIIVCLAVFLFVNLFLISKYPNILISLLRSWKIFLFEELLFFACLLFLSYIRSHAPNINGLEKFMDFGFVNSILRSNYFPPKDMWFTPFSINYYYFGHLITAILTKLSGIPSNITFNLMIATIFAFTFTCSFSIGANLFSNVILNSFQDLKEKGFRNKFGMTEKKLALTAGFLSAFLVSLAGNLHTIYTLFTPYQNDNAVPFWQLVFSPQTFPNSYWYPNATRFIYNTIHEFPSYSFVVSDLHGHVLSIPIVLTIIALLLSIFTASNQQNSPQTQNLELKTQNYNSKLKIFNYLQKLFTFHFSLFTLLAFMLAIAYMTNAWDGIIYFMLTVLVIGFLGWKQTWNKEVQNTTNTTNFKYYKYFNIVLLVVLVCIGSIIFSLPFSLHFKPFVSGIGVLCMPKFLTNIGSFGPFLFEADHCQRSPLYQLLILYGFFYFFVVSFIVFLSRIVILSPPKAGEGSRKILHFAQNDIMNSDKFVLILILLSTLLIVIPEFIYVKDIYPAHYRANTMFKLVYQAFMMLSLVSGYAITRIITNIKYQMPNAKYIYWKLVVFGIGSIGLFLVMIYPYFSVGSFYGELRNYQGLDGTKYLKTQYPTDYEAIVWLNKNIKGQPVILEAQGDSYTDYARVSANTGLPTVLGWLVHEWLWRGSYDIPKPRIEEVKTLYESDDLQKTKELIKKYNIELVFLGDLEREKYPSLREEKFEQLGKILFQQGETKIYRIK